MAASYGQLLSATQSLKRGTLKTPSYSNYVPYSPSASAAYTQQLAKSYPTSTASAPTYQPYGGRTMSPSPAPVSRSTGPTYTGKSYTSNIGASYGQAMGGSNMNAQIQQAINSISAGSASARQANVQRQARIESMYADMLKSVGRGGAFEKSGLADIEKTRVSGVGEETQSMISSGVYGTTTAAGVGAKHRDIAAQSRIKLEDLLVQRELGVKQQTAGFLERIEDSYPDYSQLLSMLAR